MGTGCVPLSLIRIPNVITFGIRINESGTQPVPIDQTFCYQGEGKRGARRTARRNGRRRFYSRILEKRYGLRFHKNELVGQWQNIEQSCAATHGHFSIVQWVPGKPNAWLKIV